MFIVCITHCPKFDENEVFFYSVFFHAFHNRAEIAHILLSISVHRISTPSLLPDLAPSDNLFTVLKQLFKRHYISSKEKAIMDDCRRCESIYFYLFDLGRRRPESRDGSMETGAIFQNLVPNLYYRM